MKQIGSPTTLGAHGFKGRRRVRARGRPLGISAALNRRLREKTSGTQRNLRRARRDTAILFFFIFLHTQP